MPSVQLLAGLAGLVSASAVPHHQYARSLDLLPRMLPNAPDGYTPEAVNCPSTRPSLRTAGALSTQESDWLSTRREQTTSAMETLLNRLNISGFDATTYFNNYRSNSTALPNFGIALSGGGYRALMNGAGALAAFDDRTENATNAGGLGGVLQSSTYLAGLSGGGWLVSSIYANNFTSVQAIQRGSGGLWDFSNNILEGPDTDAPGVLSTADYWSTIYDNVEGKSDAGYNTSITDYWGRALAFQLINDTDGGVDYTWSSVALQDLITQGQTPLPILVADGRAPGQRIISLNSTVYEFNPWEMGSWDPTVFGFAPLEYTGSNFSAGSLPSNESCVRGFDNAGYVLGTSSSLFNQAIFYLNNTSIPDFINTALTDILNDIGDDNNDIADWTPNPFYQFHPETNPNADTRRLTLVDGGEDGQNIPLNPLIQPYRSLDAIIAVDSSADTTYNWPNGTSMVATYERSTNASVQNGTSFPYVPDQNTFVNLGLNLRPTFFGCDANNFSVSTTTGEPGPLIVYLPHAFYSYQSNFSTYDGSYERDERDFAIQNGYNVATRGNNTVAQGSATDWPTCLMCALLSRSFDRTGTTYPDVCNTCFTEYCWNGTVASYEPTDATLNETAQLNSTFTSAADVQFSTPAMTGVVTFAALAAAMLMM